MATTQQIPLGPAASQVAIKLLGTNGGGFFNANSAHPFENPTAISNFIEMLAILLIPASLCYTFGSMILSRRKGIALLIAMMILFLPLAGIAIWSESSGNPGFPPAWHRPGARDTPAGRQHGGQGTPVRDRRVVVLLDCHHVDVPAGRVNSMHDSLYAARGPLPSSSRCSSGRLFFGGNRFRGYTE